MSPSLVTPQRFAEGVTFGADLTCTGSAENLVREALGATARKRYDRRNEHEQSPQCAPLSFLPVACFEIRTHRINR